MSFNLRKLKMCLLSKLSKIEFSVMNFVNVIVLNFQVWKSLWEFEKHMPGLQNCSQLKDRHLQFPQTLHSLSWLRY